MEVHREDRVMSHDALLLARVARSDQEAFHALYGTHAERVIRYAMSILRNRHLAEEVLQETMLAVWKTAKAFQGRSKVSTWILGIARNQAYNLLRREKRGQRLPEEKNQAVNPSDNAELEVRIERAMETLSESHREILHLVFYEDLTLRETAAILGIPEGTAKSRMHHARKAMGKELSC